MQITTIIFDCFGVICSPVLNGWYKKYTEENGFVDNNISAVLEKFDLGKLSENDIIEYFSKYNNIQVSKEVLRQEIDSFLSINRDLEKYITHLKNKGLKIALLSNGNVSFFKRKIYPTYPEFQGLFHEIIISSEIGMVKPSEEIYQFTLDKLKSKAEESLFVDDSKINVNGAIKVGMDGHLYTSLELFVNKLQLLKLI